MNHLTKIKLLAYLLLAVFVGLSFIIPHFTIILVLLAAIYWAIDTYTNRTTFNYNPVIVDTDMENFRYYKYSYLHSPEWQRLRNQIYQRDQSCRLCGSTDHLNVHHRHYRSLANEHPNDLVLLCYKCHSDLHASLGYPQSYKDYMSFTDPTNYKDLPCI